MNVLLVALDTVRADHLSCYGYRYRTTPNIDELAEITEGYSGADLEALVREAALQALREDINTTKVHMRHFEKALTIVKPSITPLFQSNASYLKIICIYNEKNNIP